MPSWRRCEALSCCRIVLTLATCTQGVLENEEVVAFIRVRPSSMVIVSDGAPSELDFRRGQRRRVHWHLVSLLQDQQVRRS